jgi:hypothetical protein
MNTSSEVAAQYVYFGPISKLNYKDYIDYLVIRTTKAPSKSSKSVFSISSDIVIKKRKRLLPQTVRGVLLLRGAAIYVEVEESDSEV